MATKTYENGAKQEVNGVISVYYDGYWIKYYDPPKENLSAKKKLIQSLTRRLFNHMEHGINIPGKKLDEVRASYDAETDPRKKRIKGAMLAGTLFNRAADIFTHLVELEDCGVKIVPGNDLMHACGLCLREALEFGKMVKHRNGDEGIDELWGEPFKAFIMSIDDFYQGRYLKIAMTMKNIDEVAQFMIRCIKYDSRFQGIEPLILEYALMARRKCEILVTDKNILDVWSNFVVAGEAITEFEPLEIESRNENPLLDIVDSQHLLKAGVKLLAFITRARTPMPKSTKNYLQECERYKLRRC